MFINDLYYQNCLEKLINMVQLNNKGFIMIKLLTIILVLSMSLNADIVHFKNGSSITGTIESQDTQTVKINGTTYSMSDVKSVDKGTTTAPPPPAAPATTQDTTTSTTTEASDPNLVGPTGVTGTIRRTHRRIGRRDGANID